MSNFKGKIEEEIKFYEGQREQAKEIYIKAIGSIEALKKVLEDKKDSK
jgi:hypothetical protein